MRNPKKTYCFLKDNSSKYYRAIRQPDGSYAISKNAQPYPIKHNPSNLNSFPLEFGTNKNYFSLTRSVTDPLSFIEDGAAILREFYHAGKGTEAELFLIIADWDGTDNLYKLSYYGKISFITKNEHPKEGSFTVLTIDDSAWGVLSSNDDVEYAIECNERNPKAIRVLFDGLTLVNRYTFQTVQSPLVFNAANTDTASYTMPFVMINEDGDSSGITTKNQSFEKIVLPPADDNGSWFLSTAYDIQDVNISGEIMFQWNGAQGSSTVFATGINIVLQTNFKTIGIIFGRGYPGPGILQDGQIYKASFNATFDLQVGEKVFLVLKFLQPYVIDENFTVTPIVTNLVIRTQTTPEPAIVYGLRPLDLLQQLVAKATNSRYSIDSLFFVENNKDIVTSGEALRGISNAKIYWSFKSFFDTFNPLYFMALRTILGNLWMEKTIEVYRQDSVIMDIGEIIDIEIEPAEEHFFNEILAGGPDIDLRHPSGRLEYNSTNTWSVPIKSTKKKYEIVTKAHTGCFEEQFLILDYRNGSTKDNSGDKETFLVRITDEMGTASEDVETFELVTIDDAILEPIIKVPLNNDVISFNKPTVKGIAPVGATVNIYVDNVLDGGTVADSQGNWTYDINTALDSYIQDVQPGTHVIDATYTDEAAPKSTVTIQINTDSVIDPIIAYPTEQENLYNNKPLLSGFAQKDQNIDISIDGVVVGSVVTNASNRWEYKVTTAIPNGAHVISINAGADTANFNVDSNVAFPLITYIGSELDGFPIINNLPLIEGVAIPGTVVDLYFDYNQNAKLGSATADVNGNWSFQVIPVTYLDTNGIPVVLAPMQNGLHTISTSLVNHTVGIVATGYKLERPDFSSITGVTDNTVWNTAYSPARMVANHYPLFASVLAKQGITSINFQKSLKNGNLRTVLNGVVVQENADIKSSSLGSPLFLLENAKIKTRTDKTFAALLEDFNKGGVIKATSRGTDLYLLPIGSMKMSSLHSDIKDWNLLFSPLTTFQSLLNLYKNGTIINLQKHSMYHSDYNTLHFVRYNFSLPEKYKVKDLYDDWFNNRNDQWLLNPDYIQKIEKQQPIVDQIIVNGLSNVVLNMYRCKDARLVDSIVYAPVVPAPVQVPDIVLEAVIDWTMYPSGQYFFVQFVNGTPVSISERIETRERWPGTILIESNNSKNLVGAFFSTGWKTVICVEGLITKQQYNVDTIPSTDASGNTKMLYQEVSSKRLIRFGTARGLPDYLYKKITLAATLDNLFIERVAYTLKDGEKIEKSESVPGHPLFYYEANFDLRDNPLGVVFEAEGENNRNSVVLVFDASAFGLPSGSLTRIEINDE